MLGFQGYVRRSEDRLCDGSIDIRFGGLGVRIASPRVEQFYVFVPIVILPNPQQDVSVTGDDFIVEALHGGDGIGNR